MAMTTDFWIGFRGRRSALGLEIDFRAPGEWLGSDLSKWESCALALLLAGGSSGGCMFYSTFLWGERV